MKKTLRLLPVIALSIFTTSTFAAPGGHMEKGWEYHEDIRIAVEANDYSQLSTQTQETISEEKFTEMVERYAEKEEHKAALEEAVAANNFAAFTALHEAHRAEKQARAEENGKEPREHEELSDKEKEEELQEKFTELVDYYEEHGVLPEREMKGKKWIKKWIKKWFKRVVKHFGASRKGLVKNALAHVSDERLEHALTKIAHKIELVENNDQLDEERKEIVLDLLAGIQGTIAELLAE